MQRVLDRPQKSGVLFFQVLFGDMMLQRIQDLQRFVSHNSQECNWHSTVQ